MPHELKAKPVDVLLDHNEWATQQLIDRCRSISDEQFHQRFEIGLGSLHDTLRHIVGVIRGWNDLLAGRDIRLQMDEKTRSCDELAELLHEHAGELRRLAETHAHDEVLEGQFRGMDYRFTRGGVITHVTTHGMHHRAQCVNMMRQLGLDGIPDVSVLRWMIAASMPSPA